MIQISPRSRRVLALRAGRVIAAVAVACGAVAVTATAASAAQSCNGGVEYGSCIDITEIGTTDLHRVHLGIDVYMSRQDAQAIIDRPGEEFSATLMGDDPAYDNALINVPVTWSAAGDGGLSAEFDINALQGYWLNEDWGQDEVYARIRLWDPRSGLRTFTTPVVYGYY